MITSFYRIAMHREAISWVLILAFLSLTLFQNHYHMYHGPASVMQDSGSQEHVTAIHGHTDIQDISHHEDSHTIQPAADASLKTPGVQLHWVIILMTFSLLLPLLALAGRQLPLPILHRLPRFNRRSTPPLRAPPR